MLIADSCYMADTFQLEIVTPEKKVVDTSAEEVQIPGKNGYLGVLPGHAPLITELAVGEITFREGAGSNANEQRLAVAWGLSYPPDEIGEILPPSAIDDIPPARPYDLTGRFVSKDLV